MLRSTNGLGPSMEIASEGLSASTTTNGTGIVPSQSARIEVIGVGGGGSNAVNRMIASDLQGVGYRVLAGRDALSLERLHEPSGQQRITIAPVVSGAGGNGLGQILLGAALIAVSWWNPMGWAAAGSFLSQATLYSVGTSMILGGVAQMIAPTAKAQDPSERPENQPSYVFNGAVNTTAQGHPVPVGYGRLIVGSAVISAGIDVDEIAV